MKLILYYSSVLITLLFIFLSFYNMTVYLSYFNMFRSSVMAVSWVGYLTLFINILSLMYIISIIPKMKKDKIVLILVIIFLFQFFSNFINSNSYKNIINYIFQFNSNLIPLTVYLLILNTPLKSYNNLIKILKSLYILTLIVYLYYWNLTNSSMYAGEGFASFNNAYYLAYLLPVFLIHKSKINHFIIIITLIVVISSMKRGGTIGYILGIICYYFSTFKNIPFVKKVIISFFTIFILGVIMYFVDIFLNNTLFGRFEKISEDKGSARSSIFEEIFNNYLDFNFFELIIGKGENISVLLNSEQLTAHNDYLEILVSYGIFGVILYLIFFLIQLNLIKKLIRLEDINKSSTLTYMMILTLFLMLVSHVIIYPLFIIYIINLGIINSQLNFKQNENRTFSIS